MTTLAIKNKIVPILKRQGVLKAAIFGSYARGEQTKKSDVDLLIESAKGKTFFDIIGLKLELEDKLKKKVDIVEYGAINRHIRQDVLKEQKQIYEKKR